MINDEQLQNVKVGDMFRNVHTGDCHPLTMVDELKTYNPITKQSDKILKVYVLSTSRWNKESLCPNWELVGEVGECQGIDFLYGVNYGVDKPIQGTWRDKNINDTLSKLRSEGDCEE